MEVGHVQASGARSASDGPVDARSNDLDAKLQDVAAYFITWTTYGTRLHGDARGSVHKNDAEFGTPRLNPEPGRLCGNQRRLEHLAQILDQPRRRIVRDPIIAHAAFRGWTLLALNVRTNHVHLVVKRPGVPPEKVMEQFKAWCTRRLREAGLLAAEQPLWTEHGSTKWIFNPNHVLDVVRYVRDEQGPDLD